MSEAYQRHAVAYGNARAGAASSLRAAKAFAFAWTILAMELSELSKHTSIS